MEQHDNSVEQFEKLKVAIQELLINIHHIRTDVNENKLSEEYTQKTILGFYSTLMGDEFAPNSSFSKEVYGKGAGMLKEWRDHIEKNIESDRNFLEYIERYNAISEEMKVERERNRQLPREEQRRILHSYLKKLNDLTSVFKAQIENPPLNPSPQGNLLTIPLITEFVEAYKKRAKWLIFIQKMLRPLVRIFYYALGFVITTQTDVLGKYIETTSLVNFSKIVPYLLCIILLDFLTTEYLIKPFNKRKFQQMLNELESILESKFYAIYFSTIVL